MKKNVFCWNGMTMRKQDACEVYQEMCDEVFGKGAVRIPVVSVYNAVLLHLLFVNVFEKFYENLKSLLERLKEKMEAADELDWLLDAVERMAFPEDGEKVYAQLVAWDVMWNLHEEGHVGLDNYVVDVLDETEGEGSPCELAKAHKHMVMEKFGDDIMYYDQHVVVLVKTPWNSNQCRDNGICDYMYHRNLARRTFIEYVKDEDTMLKDIIDDYYGDEPVASAVMKLNGIVLIDMVTLDGKIICHSFVNPNSCEMDDDDERLLHEVVKQGDEEGICEDFESDNY